MIAEPLLRPLENMLNRNIGMSTPARELARELDGRRVVIRSAEIDLNISFEFSDEVAVLSTASHEGADCVIEGSLLTLLRLTGKDPEAAFRDGSANIQGDALVGKSFRQLLKFARPDWEEELSRVLGDVPAHQLARGIRQLFGWGERSTQAMAQNAAEFLQEESRDLPSSAEAGHFMSEVDELREQADRLDARLKKLEQGRAQ